MAVTLAASMGSQLGLMVSGVLVARMLGPHDRGLLAIVALVPLIVCQLGTLGLPVATTYLLANPGSGPSAGWLLRRALPGQLLALPAVQLAALLGLVRSGTAELPQGVLALSVLIPVGSVCQLYGVAVFQGLRRFRAFNAWRLAPVVLYAFFVCVLFVASSGSLLTATAAYAGAQVLTGAAILVHAGSAVHPRTSPINTATHTSPTRFHPVRFGLKSVIGSASPTENFRLDQAVVGMFLTPVALGYYVAALSLTNLPRFFGLGIGMVAYPRVAEEATAKRARAKMWTYTGATATVATLSGGSLWLLMPALLPFFFGEQFAGAVPAARLLLPGAVFFAIRRTLIDASRGAGYPGRGSLAELLSWLVSVPLVIFLTPRAGVEGVATALSAGAGVSLAALLFSCIRVTRADVRPARPPANSRQNADPVPSSSSIS